MSTIETITLRTTTAGVSSRRYQRRMLNDNAMAEHAAAVAFAASPPPVVADDPEFRSNVDRATPELRRRILEVAAEQRGRRSGSSAWPVTDELPIPRRLGLGGLVFALWNKPTPRS